MRRLLFPCFFAMVVFSLGLAPNASAQSKPFNPRTPRALGMGNAQIAVGGDYNSLFYNPAGLATIEEMEIQVIAPLLETNMDTIGLISDALDVDAASANQFLATHAGDPGFMRSNSISYFTMKKGPVAFGVSALIDYTVEQAIISDGNALTPADETFITRKTTDIGGVVGASVDIIENWLAAGLNLKLFNRWNAANVDIPNGGTGDFDIDSEIIKPFGDCGTAAVGCASGSDFGAGVDLGALFSVPLEEIPALGNAPAVKGSRFQLGLVWQDVASTRIDSATFSPSFGAVAVTDNIPQTVDLGIAYIQSIVIGNLKVAVDFRDLNRDEISIGDKTSLGAELEFNKFVTLRAGMNETGFATGATLRLWVVRIDGGFFQEKTELPSRGRDERFFVAMGLGWYN